MGGGILTLTLSTPRLTATALARPPRRGSARNGFAVRAAVARARGMWYGERMMPPRMGHHAIMGHGSIAIFLRVACFVCSVFLEPFY